MIDIDKLSSTDIENLGKILAELPLAKTQLKDYPPILVNNESFLSRYFSNKPSNEKEYKQIPQHMLNDPIFIYSCLKINPDIYLLADEKIRTPSFYQEIEKHHPSTILKYATKEQQASYDFCKKNLNSDVTNYQYVSDELKSNYNICKKVFFYKESFSKFLPKMALENRIDLIEPLLHDLEYNFFKYLPLEYTNNKKLCNKMVLKRAERFSVVPLSIRKDKEWVLPIMNLFLNYRTSDLNHILPHLPIEYFEEDFCNKYQKYISNNFNFLSKEVRSCQNVLVATFSNRSDYYLSRDAVKFITEIGLKKELKHYFQHIDKNNDIEFQKTTINIINSYFLNKKLENSLSVSENPLPKKIKI